MYLTVKNQLRQLSAHEFQTLREMCRLSKNLYNEALYNVRQYYFSENKYLHYESNYHLCKSSPNYKTLGTEAAQQTMKVVDIEKQDVRVTKERPRKQHLDLLLAVKLFHKLPVKIGLYAQTVQEDSRRNTIHHSAADTWPEDKRSSDHS